MKLFRSKEAMKKFTSRREKAWTMAHSHFMLMGGLAIVPGTNSYYSSSIPRDQFLQGYFDRLTITPDGVAFLADLDPKLIPEISESDIEDKSKASRLTKALVCLQAFWFCLQCVARLNQGLKLSLLELNTFAHALCALLIYLLWWDKPLDIDEPIVIQQTESTLPIIALPCMASRYGQTWESPQGYLLSVCPTFSQDPHSIKNQGDMGRVQTTQCSENTKLVLGNELHGFRISEFDIPDDDEFPYDATRKWQEENPRSDSTYLQLEKGQARCFELATRAIDKYGIKNWEFPHLDGLLTTTVSDKPKLDPSRSSTGKEVVIGFAIAGIVYGGLHLSGWNAPFPDTLQRCLWRVSSLVLFSSGPALAILMFGTECYGATFTSWRSGWQRCFRCFIIATPWYLVVIAGFMIYILARVYLVIECVIMLWYMPDDVYIVPNWTQYIPHII